MRKVFISFIFILFTLLAKAQTVYFSSNSAILPDTARKVLLDNLTAVRKRLEYITVSGFTDSTGNKDSNLVLSARRANAVKDFFVQQGYNADSVYTNHFGAARFVAGNATTAGRSKNRRVEIEYKLKWQPDYVDALDDIELLYQQLKEPGSRFCINPLRDTMLVAAQGSIIVIPANTFAVRKECTCITIEFHEYFSKADMILNNLTTTSNELPLASGGMTKLEAYCGDTAVSFNAGRTITVMVPTSKPEKGMSMFTGNRHLQKELINWADAQYKDVELFNLNDLMRCLLKRDAIPCHFFFCKIRRFVKEVFDAKERRYNKARKALDEQTEAQKEQLRKFISDPGMLKDALDISKANNKDAVAYYVYKSASFDYHNIDRLLSGGKFKPFHINEPYDSNKDIRIVLKETKTVLPAIKSNAIYEVKYLFANTSFTIIGLQMHHGKILLAKKDTDSDEKDCRIEFNEVSIAELKESLRVLGR